MLSLETRTHACEGKRFAVVHSFTERVNKQTKTSSVGVEKQEKKKISFPFKGFNFERMIIIIVMMMTKMPTTENKFCLSAWYQHLFNSAWLHTFSDEKSKHRVRSKSV